MLRIDRGETMRIAAIVLTFTCAALVSARHIAPYVDEAMVFSSARNLILHGHIGASIIDPTSETREGQSLRGIDRYTYQVMPFHFLVQAVWYRAVGMGLLRMRALSALCGIFALVAWYLIVKGLGESQRAAWLAMALIGTDSLFVVAGAFGRCDMLATSLSSMGIASYVVLRGRHLPLAVLTGHTFAAASVFTHPAGILSAAALVWMPLYLDFPRLRIKLLWLAVAPYIVGATAWGIYILQAPDIFREQIQEHANRLYGITQPWLGLWGEIRLRYLDEFGLRQGDHGVARLKLVLLAVYFLAPVAVAVSRGLRIRRGVRALLLLAISNFLIFGIFEGTKQGFYLVHVVPLHTVLLALWVREAWGWRPGWKVFLAAVLAVFVGLQAMRIVSFNRKDRMHREYEAVASFLKESTSPSWLVLGSCTLAFALGFDAHLVDDHRLGYFSGKVPDVIVVDERYREMFDRMKTHRPDLYSHVIHLLDSGYVKRYDQRGYQVYFRRT